MSVNDGLHILDQRKHPALVIHQEHPLNTGTPPELARQSYITPRRTSSCAIMAPFHR
jgi:hypothetical protein